MKLGKRPARPGSIRLALRKYVSLSRLPAVPPAFGHDSLVPTWGVLGNDQWGDCFWAGACHETMLWNREAGHEATFDAKDALADYAAATGFDPAKPETDQGTDMQEGADYRRKVGIVDSSGARHKVAAYVAIGAGNLEEHLVAAYVFGAVGVGIEFPASAMAQFTERTPWEVVKASPIQGGHYVPLTAFKDALLTVVTWGELQSMTEDFLYRYNDESVVYMSDEILSGGKTIEGFDLEQLQHDLALLGAGVA